MDYLGINRFCYSIGLSWILNLVHITVTSHLCREPTTPHNIHNGTNLTVSKSAALSRFIAPSGFDQRIQYQIIAWIL